MPSSQGPREEGEVTLLLRRWESGDEQAPGELMALIGRELRQLARSRLRRERPNHTLQATELVNEAYLKLVKAKSVSYEDRTQFYGAVSRVMMELLIDYARRDKRKKRWGHLRRERLTKILGAPGASQPELEAVDEALRDLAAREPLQARIVWLRFFVGFGHGEVATALGLPVSRVRREWSEAKDWLYQALGPA